MSGEYDAIVIGLGGMGSAALATLARRGQRVLGLEQFQLGHDRGSSHGHTRVIRTAYFEHPAYVPLCKQAFVAWRDLELRTGTKLLVDSPCLTIGKPDGELIAGVRAAAAEHRLPVESLTAVALRKRFPLFQFDESYEAVLEHESGFLYVDRCVLALLDDARAAGATIHEREAVQHWDADATGVTVETELGRYRAARLVITAGPWAASLLGAIGAPLTVMRQVVIWFEPSRIDDYRAGRFPIFLADTPQGCFYSIPATDGRGLKLARHYGAPELTSPEHVERAITDADEAPIREFLRKHLKAADGPRADASICLYTLSPDRHFILDRHPEFADVALAAGFSGHGFKFAPVVGEMLADLVDGSGDCVPSLFRLNRLTRAPS